MPSEEDFFIADTLLNTSWSS